MKLLVGLGNPGREYDKTRHNAGFMVVDRLVARFAPGVTAKARFQAVSYEAPVGSEKVLFLKPTTYMNRSGPAVAEALGFYKLDPRADLMVVVDDFYLPVGSVRIRPGGGTGGHNGLESLRGSLGTDDYPRLRVGVGERPSGGKPAHFDQADYVLSRFSDDEWSELEPALDKAAKAAELFVGSGLDAAMNFANASGAQRPEQRPERHPQPLTNHQTPVRAPHAGDGSN